MTSNPPRKGIPFVISAPSGTGKTTTCKLLRQRLPELGFSVSHTTRKPRQGEVHGVDYHFIPEEEFKRKIEQGDFLEYAQVHNHYYGTAFETVDRFTQNGDDILLELDVQGVETLRTKNYPAVYIFILPPSLEELKKRLTQRGTETAEKIQERIEVGKHEITRYTLYDYVTTNFVVEETVDNLVSIIHAERSRSSRYQPPCKDIAALLRSKASI
ncbi:MAG: guanylate kinase [Nitrospinae bacterium CG11_big_fil_rev_8_21_14_0_20_56_8]|nr:MAG: guanylate kinase [Nitrospinae bacterium CG11_big_fil_rev_8_21_14_0_20_56_8]